MEDKFLEVAKQAALEAGRILKKHFGKQHKYFLKKDPSDFATQADLESEQVIIRTITKYFPSHNIVAEEKGTDNKKSEYTWVIDPLDGTIAFAAGLPFFAVSIGLLKDSKPILGVVYQVMAGELYWGKLGQGAYLNGKKIKVTVTNKLEDANMGIDFGHLGSRSHKNSTFIMPIMNRVRYLYELGSDATMLALIAKGVLDGLATDAWVWDFAGAAVIIEEAGGRVTDPKGKEIDWTKDRIAVVASNGLIHDQILEALNS